jgi:hypothetical protein
MSTNGNACGIRVVDEVLCGVLPDIEGKQEAMEVGPEPASLFGYDVSKELLARLRHDADLRESICSHACSTGRRYREYQGWPSVGGNCFRRRKCTYVN